MEDNNRCLYIFKEYKMTVVRNSFFAVILHDLKDEKYMKERYKDRHCVKMWNRLLMLNSRKKECP